MEEQQQKTQSKQKKSTKIRAEINKKEMKKTTANINKTKSQFLRR